MGHPITGFLNPGPTQPTKPVIGLLSFFSRGRQLAEPQRPNAKFREDCWSEDEESPPPPIDYGTFL